MQITQIADGLLKVVRDEATYLGINTYIPGRSFAVQRLTAEKRTPGWIVRGQAVSEWLPKGFTEHEREVIMYGPYEDGKTLEEVLESEGSRCFGYLARLAAAMGVLHDRNIDLWKLHTRGVLFLSDGGILFLPADIMKTIREHQTVLDQMKYFENLNHPDLDPLPNASYFLAALAYRLTTGDLPYAAERLEDLHIRVRAGYVLDPIYREPNLREDISSFLIQFLRSPAEQKVGFDEWASRLSEWDTGGVTRELSANARAEIEQRADQTWKRMTKSFNRKEYIRKHGKLTVIIAAIVLVVGTIPGTIISKALQPRSTHGYSAEKVVQTFYLSMNSLDHMTMSDCVIEGAGKGLINETMNLYVTSRMRMSVEMQSGIVGAQKWVDDGKPPLKNASYVYGVSNLDTTVLNQTPDETVIEAKYLRWEPDFPQNDTAPAAPSSQPVVITTVAYQNQDKLYLKKDRGDWVIYKIDQESSRQVPSDTVKSS